MTKVFPPIKFWAFVKYHLKKKEKKGQFVCLFGNLDLENLKK